MTAMMSCPEWQLLVQKRINPTFKTRQSYMAEFANIDDVRLKIAGL